MESIAEQVAYYLVFLIALILFAGAWVLLIAEIRADQRRDQKKKDATGHGDIRDGS